LNVQRDLAVEKRFDRSSDSGPECFGSLAAGAERRATGVVAAQIVLRTWCS
jgi:hypothetical protein